MLTVLLRHILCTCAQISSSVEELLKKLSLVAELIPNLSLSVFKTGLLSISAPIGEENQCSLASLFCHTQSLSLSSLGNRVQ